MGNLQAARFRDDAEVDLRHGQDAYVLQREEGRGVVVQGALEGRGKVHRRQRVAALPDPRRRPVRILDPFDFGGRVEVKEGHFEDPRLRVHVDIDRSNHLRSEEEQTGEMQD